MSDYPETQAIAGLMARGYNRHIREYGPDGSYASEVIESGDGHGVVVERGGSQFAVRVEMLPARTASAPMTPGQCWAALKKHIASERTAQDTAAADHSEGWKRVMGWLVAYLEKGETVDTRV